MGKPKKEDKEKEELKKGPWTPEEDQKLLASLKSTAMDAGVPSLLKLRCGKSCRLRWTDHIRPDIKRGNFSSQEDMTIIRLHALLGNRWSTIAMLLPKRTDSEIKNYWNSRLKKLLTRMGIDPVTHKPKNRFSEWAQSKQAAIVSHLAQWETARLQAEARLARAHRHKSSKLQARVQAPKPPCLDVLRVWKATASRNNFFGSSVSLVSLQVPGVADDVVSTNNGQVNGEMEKSVQLLHHDHFAGVDYGSNMQDQTNRQQINFDHDSNSASAIAHEADFEENKIYWSELLTVVSSALEPRSFGS